MQPSIGPDFLGIGAAKAGTAWLYDQLSLHPDVWMPPIKEFHYFEHHHRKGEYTFGRQRVRRMQRVLNEVKREFDRDHCYSMNAVRRQSFKKPYDERDIEFLEKAVRLPPGLTSYATLFSFKGNALSGDITPAYSILGPREIEDIRTFFPHLKLVFLARDPIDRAISHLQMHKRRSKGNFDLEDVGAIEAFLKNGQMDLRSRPVKTIHRWREFFPAEQLHIEIFDGLARDAAGVRRRIFQFLGLSPDKGADAIPADFNRKKSRPKYPISPLARDLLIELYRDEILQCAALLGGAAKEWPSRYGL